MWMVTDVHNAGPALGQVGSNLKLSGCVHHTLYNDSGGTHHLSSSFTPFMGGTSQVFIVAWCFLAARAHWQGPAAQHAQHGMGLTATTIIRISHSGLGGIKLSFFIRLTWETWIRIPLPPESRECQRPPQERTPTLFGMWS